MVRRMLLTVPIGCRERCGAVFEYTADRAAFFSLALSQRGFGWCVYATSSGGDPQGYEDQPG